MSVTAAFLAWLRATTERQRRRGSRTDRRAEAAWHARRLGGRSAFQCRIRAELRRRYRRRICRKRPGWRWWNRGRCRRANCASGNRRLTRCGVLGLYRWHQQQTAGDGTRHQQLQPSCTRFIRVCFHNHIHVLRAAACINPLPETAVDCRQHNQKLFQPTIQSPFTPMLHFQRQFQPLFELPWPFSQRHPDVSGSDPPD